MPEHQPATGINEHAPYEAPDYAAGLTAGTGITINGPEIATSPSVVSSSTALAATVPIANGTGGYTWGSQSGVGDVPLAITDAPYNAVADRLDLTGVGMESGSAVLSSAHVFTSADVGKLIYVAGAGTAGAGLPTTIHTVAAGVATLNTTAKTTVAAATASFGTDNHEAIQTCWNTATTQGVNCYAPPGRYMIGNYLNPPPGLTFRGAGSNRTVICPVNNIAIYNSGYSIEKQLTDLLFEDFQLDCSFQLVGQKGMYVDYMKRVWFNRVYVFNAAASGFGNDYQQDVWYTNCIAENAGRLGTTGSGGCSGFGIGTGKFERENSYYIGCIARGCKRYGIFFEQQPLPEGGEFYGRGQQIIGGLYEGNWVGIGDIGSTQAIIRDAHVINNTLDGIQVANEVANHKVGKYGQIIGCTVYGNGAHGIHLNWGAFEPPAVGNYTVKDNLVYSNTGYGIVCNTATATTEAVGPVTNVQIVNNDCYENGEAGIALLGGKGNSWSGCGVINNRSNRNGTALGSGGTRAGIYIAGGWINCRIRLNECNDLNGAGNQAIGISFIGSGQSPTQVIEGGVVEANDLAGSSGALLLNGAEVKSPTVIKNNAGYNPRGFVSTPTISGTSTFQAGAQPVTLTFVSGTVAKIKLERTVPTTGGSTTIYSAGGLPPPVTLEPWDILSYETAAGVAANLYTH